MNHALALIGHILLYAVTCAAIAVGVAAVVALPPWGKIWYKIYHTRRIAVHRAVVEAMEHRWNEPSKKYDGSIRTCRDCGANQTWDGESLKWHN